MYIDDGGGADRALGEVGWASIGDSIGDSMASFASMAAGGGFEVNESGGQALLAAIHKMQDWLASQSNELLYLEQELPLGTTHAATVMKPYVQKVATDEQGFLTQLRKFRESLNKAEQGINTAMANYRATEQANAAKLRTVNPE